MQDFYQQQYDMFSSYNMHENAIVHYVGLYVYHAGVCSLPRGRTLIAASGEHLAKATMQYIMRFWIEAAQLHGLTPSAPLPPLTLFGADTTGGSQIHGSCVGQDDASSLKSQHRLAKAQIGLRDFAKALGYLEAEKGLY